MNTDINIEKVVIKTNRLVLRQWRLSDIDDLFEYASVPDVGERAGWSHHESKEESLKVLNFFIESKKVFAIEYNNKVIGSLGIEKYNADMFPELEKLKARELGFVLSKKYWGQGLIPEACHAVISYLFNTLKLDAITCCYFQGNEQSKRVQEKLGFSHYRSCIVNTKFGDKISFGGILYNKNN